MWDSLHHTGKIVECVGLKVIEMKFRDERRLISGGKRNNCTYASSRLGLQVNIFTKTEYKAISKTT